MRARVIANGLVCAAVAALLSSWDAGTVPAGPTGAVPAPTGAEFQVLASPHRFGDAAVRRSFTLAAAGDVLIHAPIMREARRAAGGRGYDFDPMLARVRPLVESADLAICNQETPISADNRRLTVPRVLSYNAPRQLAGALRRAGFDACSFASNHLWDRGLRGIRETLDVLDDAGVAHSGGTRNGREAARPPVHEVNGVRVGHLAYSYGIVNTAGPSHVVPGEAPWLRAMLWPEQGAAGIRAQARELRERGAEFVVVSIHWGAQYVARPTGDQRRLARALLSAPEVDLILGHHAHVVQPCQRINGKYVLYGLGNFLSNQSPTQAADLPVSTQDGVLVRFRVEETSPGRFRAVSFQYAPTWVTIPGHVVRRATPSRYPESYRRTARALHPAGAAGGCGGTPLP